jgi:hypothetical protein
MWSGGIMPEATSCGAPEKLHGFDTHAFALPARHKGEDKNDQFGEGEFAFTGKIGV